METIRELSKEAKKHLKDVDISIENDYAGLDRFIFITNITKFKYSF